MSQDRNSKRVHIDVTTVLEYALIVALIAVVAISAISALGTTFRHVAQDMESQAANSQSR